MGVHPPKNGINVLIHTELGELQDLGTLHIRLLGENNGAIASCTLWLKI